MTTPPVDTSHNPPPKRPWLKQPVVWLGALITAIITGVLVSVATGVASHIIAGSAAPNIEVDSMTAEYLPPSPQGELQDRPVKIDFKIRNIGSQLAIITAARVTVQQFAILPICLSQGGGLSSTGTYSAFLPRHPSPGRSVDIPTSQQAGPDDAVRFDITLGLQRVFPGVDVDIYLYQIRVGLLYDKSSVPADAGKAVIALPGPPDYAYLWTKDNAARPDHIPTFMGNSIPQLGRCLVNNSRELNAILAMAGTRPAQLTAIQSQLSFCCGWTLPTIKAIQICGPALVRPVDMSLTCDGTGALETMKWSAWTFEYATGTGIYRYQSCTPSCANGNVHDYNVAVRFDEPTDTAKDGWLWDRVTFDFPTGSPYGRSTIVQSNLVPSQLGPYSP